MHKCILRSEPPMSEYVTLPDGIDADEAWRAMTEEEESLVQEEQSLKKEIEEVRALFSLLLSLRNAPSSTAFVELTERGKEDLSTLDCKNRCCIITRSENVGFLSSRSLSNLFSIVLPSSLSFFFFFLSSTTPSSSYNCVLIPQYSDV